MLARKYRLLSKTKMSPAKSINTPFFILKYAQNEEPYPKFGFVISKSVDKRASTRFKLKRRFRNCIEGMLPTIKTDRKMLFILKKEMSDLKKDQLCSEISELLKKEKLLIK